MLTQSGMINRLREVLARYGKPKHIYAELGGSKNGILLTVTDDLTNYDHSKQTTVVDTPIHNIITDNGWHYSKLNNESYNVYNFLLTPGVER